MKENGNDLLLAKRRMIVIFPFIILNFGISITMIVFSSILFYRINAMRDDYKIEYNDYQYENTQECNDISGNLKNNKNFSSFFNIASNLTKLENPVAHCMAYSITSVTFLTLFLLISGCLMLKYVRKSDEEIKQNPSFIPNKKHICTLCFIIIKIIFNILIQICLITFLCVTFSVYTPKIFEGVYNFADKCVKNKDSFKKKYFYCWGFETPFHIYTFFTIINLILDIISFIFIYMSEKYNVWSFILHKLTCGKFEYIEVDYKGFIIPGDNGDKETNLIKGDDEETNMAKENEEANNTKGNEEANVTKREKEGSKISVNDANMVKGDIINDVSYDNE